MYTNVKPLVAMILFDTIDIRQYIRNIAPIFNSKIHIFQKMKFFYLNFDNVPFLESLLESTIQYLFLHLSPPLYDSTEQ